MYMYWQQINPTLQCSSLKFAVTLFAGLELELVAGVV